jgi:formate/nitrite transporter FocA (FNT family)
MVLALPAIHPAARRQAAMSTREHERRRQHRQPATAEPPHDPDDPPWKEPEQQELEAHEHGVPEGEVMYRSARQDGDYTLRRPSVDLVWSGVAAGLSMGFSLAGEGLLRAHLPDATWAPLISKLGYALGFVIVILGRQQLFTEQTLTAVLPWLSKDRDRGVADVARVWVIILAANLVGVAVFALVAARTSLFSPDVAAAFSEIGDRAMSERFATVLLRGIAAGFLIATMVWLLPGAGSARLWIVIILAYVVGLAELAHVIAGSGECLYVVFRGERSVGDFLGLYLVPSFLGNSIGGVALVASLAHGQHAPAEST